MYFANYKKVNCRMLSDKNRMKVIRSGNVNNLDERE